MSSRQSQMQAIGRSRERKQGVSMLAVCPTSPSVRGSRQEEATNVSQAHMSLLTTRCRSVAHQASSHGHRISKNPHLPSTSSGLPQAYALPISPASRWSVGPSLAGLDPPAPANDPTATQVGGTQDFFSMYNTFEQPSSRPVSHYIRPVGGSSGIEIGMDPNEPSLFYTDANTARSNQSKGLHQSSGPSGSPNHPASRGRLASQPHGRPQGAMSVTQELQAVKDDLGIPTTRDVSRNASPEVREERGTAPGWSSPESSDFAGLAPGTCEPDVPGVLTAEDVAELFDKSVLRTRSCPAS